RQPVAPRTMSTSAPIVPIFREGKWITQDAGDYMPVHNPSTGEVIARTPLLDAAQVDAVVEAAANAFTSWSKTSFSKRSAILFKYKELLEGHLLELSQMVTRENGKTLEEAKGDVRRGIECVEFACGIQVLAKGENLPQLAEMMDGVTSREPIGVCAGIVPFNF